MVKRLKHFALLLSLYWNITWSTCLNGSNQTLSWKLKSLLSLLWKTRWINSFQITFQCLNPVGATVVLVLSQQREIISFTALMLLSYKWIKIFKNEPSKICRRQLSKLYLVHSWILWPKYLTAWLSQKLIDLNSPEENNSINHAHRGFRNPLPFYRFCATLSQKQVLPPMIF